MPHHPPTHQIPRLDETGVLRLALRTNTNLLPRRWGISTAASSVSGSTFGTSAVIHQRPGTIVGFKIDRQRIKHVLWPRYHQLDHVAPPYQPRRGLLVLLALSGAPSHLTPGQSVSLPRTKLPSPLGRRCEMCQEPTSHRQRRRFPRTHIAPLPCDAGSTTEVQGGMLHPLESHATRASLGQNANSAFQDLQSSLHHVTRHRWVRGAGSAYTGSASLGISD